MGENMSMDIVVHCVHQHKYSFVEHFVLVTGATVVLCGSETR